MRIKIPRTTMHLYRPGSIEAAIGVSKHSKGIPPEFAYPALGRCFEAFIHLYCSVAVNYTNGLRLLFMQLLVPQQRSHGAINIPFFTGWCSILFLFWRPDVGWALKTLAWQPIIKFSNHRNLFCVCHMWRKFWFWYWNEIKTILIYQNKDQMIKTLTTLGCTTECHSVLLKVFVQFSVLVTGH